MSDEITLGAADNDREEKILSVLGLCARSRELIMGVPQICDALGKVRKKGKYPLIVFEASDTSQNTHKRISDKCGFYKVKHVRLATDGETLAKRLGKTSMLAAVAVTNENLCLLAEKYI
jgi:ribosomal protein L7Ae-like RNA K-turn-binding protein